MDNQEAANANEASAEAEERFPTVMAPIPGGGPCVGHPNDCIIAASVMTQGEFQPTVASTASLTSDATKSLVGQHGTFGVLTVVLDMVAPHPFNLNVAYTIDGKETDGVVSANTEIQNSHRRIFIAQGSQTGYTDFKIVKNTAAKEVVITVTNLAGDELLKQTLSALEQPQQATGVTA